MSVASVESLADRLGRSATARRVGPVGELPTPFVLVDGNVMLANLRGMAEATAASGLRLRPHVKTHKSALLAQLQLDFGAVGLTSAKPSEAAEVASSAVDLLVAYPCFTGPRLASLAQLSAGRSVRMAVDGEEAVRRISAGAERHGCEFGLLIDLDVGHHRTGLSEVEAAVELALLIERSPNVRFDGLLYFPGQLVPDKIDLESGLIAVEKQLRSTIEAVEERGLRCEIVSGGSTPTARLAATARSTTEIRPGTYIFNDLNCVRWECADWDSCAAMVHATVISTAVPGKAVIDAGSKMLSSDRCGADPEAGFGYLIDHPDAKLVRLSEEHGEIELGDSDWRPKVGDRLRVLPNHICPVINLQNEIILRAEDGECYAVPVEGRGCVA